MKKSKIFLKSLIAIFAISMSISVMAQRGQIDNFRSYDKDGLNVFETPKDLDTKFDGVRLRIGGAFTQQFQALDHEKLVQESPPAKFDSVLVIRVVDRIRE